MCKGTCDQVFHLDCVKTIQYRIDRNIYFCKPCARQNRQIAKKEKREYESEESEVEEEKQGRRS